jgi:hypothetical protein
MSYLTEVERKQRRMDIFNDVTFEYTRDLSGEVLVHLPMEYNEESLSKAITMFIGMFMIETYEKLNGFSGFDSVKYNFIYKSKEHEQRSI